MLYTAYCGYANFLIVVIFVTVIMLLIILLIIFTVFLINFEMVVISLKIFNLGFFGDMEFLLTVWNLLFIFIVLVIRRRVALFSFSYMRGIMVRNFILLYVRFIFSIL